MHMSKVVPINIGLRQIISRKEEVKLKEFYVKEMGGGKHWMNFGDNPYHTLIYNSLEDLEHDKIILEKYAEKFV